MITAPSPWLQCCHMAEAEECDRLWLKEAIGRERERFACWGGGQFALTPHSRGEHGVMVRWGAVSCPAYGLHGPAGPPVKAHLLLSRAKQIQIHVPVAHTQRDDQNTSSALQLFLAFMRVSQPQCDHIGLSQGRESILQPSWTICIRRRYCLHVGYVFIAVSLFVISSFTKTSALFFWNLGVKDVGQTLEEPISFSGRSRWNPIYLFECVQFGGFWLSLWGL